ncbi:unnamed protein product [Pylaiella littoralis]
MDRISLTPHQQALASSRSRSCSNGQGRAGSHSAVTLTGTRFDSVGVSGHILGGGHGDAQQQQGQRLSSWVPGKLSGCRQWLEEKGTANGRVSSIGRGSAPATGSDLPDYLAKEVLKMTTRSAAELEAILSEVGAHDAEEAKTRVVNEMLAAIKGACEACVRQEKEERDGILANIQQAKDDIVGLSRKLGILTPADGEPDEEFFYCNQVMDTLFDRLVNLETTLDSLRTQQGDRSRAADNIVKEMETINENMDRQPEEGEFEKSGGEEWDGKEGWELSEERLEKLRGRLASLRVLKLERATEMVGLVVDCQKLFRELSPPVEHPLQHKMLMSLDPSSPADKPSLRTEAQTQTSVGLSVFNVDRLNKLRVNMQEDRQLHTARKEEHRRLIENLWEKLNVSERHRQEHLSKTKGITHSDMDELESELARLRKLKAEKLTDMLKAAREEVSQLLEVFGAKAEEVLGESARDLHVPQAHWTEALLEDHEQFVKKLQEMGERAAPIVDKVKRREELVQKREIADSLKVDYSARGASGVSSQANKVDAIKKRLKLLPNLTNALRKELVNWQNDEGFPFRYNGREYLKTIEESDMQWQHRKEIRKETSRRERNIPVRPSSPTRAALHNGTFHSTGNMAFGSGVSVSPSLHRQASNRSGNGSSTTGGGGGGGGGSLIGSPSPRTRGGSGSGSVLSAGSGPLHPATPSTGGGGRGGMGRSGSAGSNSSAVSAGGGPMVDSRGLGAAGTAGGGGGGEGARAAAGGGGGGGAGGGGEGGRDPAAKSLPGTPQKEARNPLLVTPLTPSPTFQRSRQARLPSAFASTGGSHRLNPPPPLPARPASVERSSAALSKLQSSPDLIRGVNGGGGVGVGGRVGGAPGERGRAMPPPLPERPSSAAFDRADLQAIRESNASSLRSSASASDVLSSGRRTETMR